MRSLKHQFKTRGRFVKRICFHRKLPKIQFFNSKETLHFVSIYIDVSFNSGLYIPRSVFLLSFHRTVQNKLITVFAFYSGIRLFLSGNLYFYVKTVILLKRKPLDIFLQKIMILNFRPRFKRQNSCLTDTGLCGALRVMRILFEK